MVGFSSSISNNIDCVFASNADFSGNSIPNDLNGLQTNGQIWVGATALNVGGTHINVGKIIGDATITVGYSSPNITLTIPGGSTVGRTITGNDAIPISPTAGNWNIFGTGSLTTSNSAGSTLQVALTGLTNHAVLVGAGTTTITKLAVGATNTVLLGNTGLDPSFGAVPNAALTNSTVTLNNGNNITVTGGTPLALGGTASFNLTGTTNNTVQLGNASGSLTSLATTNSATLVSSSAGVPVWSGTMTNGQMIIGSSGATPVAGTITSTGGTVTVTPGAGTLNLEVASGGFIWTETSGAFAAAKEHGYFITTTATATMPASPTGGDTIRFMVDTTNLLTIQANTGQKIRIGTTISAAAGTAINTQRGDAIELVYMSTGTTWQTVNNPVGGWNVT